MTAARLERLGKAGSSRAGHRRPPGPLPELLPEVRRVGMIGQPEDADQGLPEYDSGRRRPVSSVEEQLPSKQTVGSSNLSRGASVMSHGTVHPCCAPLCTGQRPPMGW